MANHRKPPELRVDNRASRMRAPSPKVSTPLGNAPATFTPDQAAVWKELAAAAPGDVLTSADRHAVELASVLMADFRADSRGFNSAKLTQLLRLLTAVGCTPAGRLGLALPLAQKPREPNPFDKFHN